MAHMDSKASRKTGKKKGGEALFDTDIKVNKDDVWLRYMLSRKSQLLSYIIRAIFVAWARSYLMT